MSQAGYAENYGPGGKASFNHNHEEINVTGPVITYDHMEEDKDNNTGRANAAGIYPANSIWLLIFEEFAIATLALILLLTI